MLDVSVVLYERLSQHQPRLPRIVREGILGVPRLHLELNFYLCTSFHLILPFCIIGQVDLFRSSLLVTCRVHVRAARAETGYISASAPWRAHSLQLSKTTPTSKLIDS